MGELNKSTCVLCGQLIVSAGEGGHCPGCQSSIHLLCHSRKTTEKNTTQCPVCEANLIRMASPCGEELEGQRSFPLGGNYIISRSCPRCGAKGFQPVKPDRLIAFTKDRICISCGTRYIPPTPPWAGILFVLLGLFMLGLGILMLILMILGSFGGRYKELLEGVFGVIFGCGIGFLALVHGLRSLFQSGKV